jgi:hypothetical protein
MRRQATAARGSTVAATARWESLRGPRWRRQRSGIGGSREVAMVGTRGWPRGAARRPWCAAEQGAMAVRRAREEPLRSAREAAEGRAGGGGG